MRFRFFRRKESPVTGAETPQKKERWWRRFFAKRKVTVPVEPLRENSAPTAREKIEKKEKESSTFLLTAEMKTPEPPSVAETALSLGTDLVDAGVELTETAVDATLAVGEEAAHMLAEEKRLQHEKSLTGTPPAGETPPWADRDVTLEEINIRTLPINWSVLAELGRKLREFRYVIDGQTSGFDFSSLKPPPEAEVFVPIIASIVAHHRNPDIPVQKPTDEQMRAARPWISAIGWFLGRFSERLQRRFNDYVSERGEQIVVDIAHRIIGFAEFAGTIENPKRQFLSECERVYRHLCEKKVRQGFWGEEEIPIEEKVARFIRELQWAKRNPHALDDESFWINRKNFPLLLALIEKLKIPIDAISPEKAGIVGAELAGGMYLFLVRAGVTALPPPPKAREVSVFDPSTWGRGLAEWFAPKTIEHVRRALPDILTLTYEALPESGPGLRDAIFNLAEKICILHQKGVRPSEIVSSMFPGMKTMGSGGAGARSHEAEMVMREAGAGAVIGLIGGSVAAYYFGTALTAILWIQGGVFIGAVVGIIVGIIALLRHINKKGANKGVR